MNTMMTDVDWDEQKAADLRRPKIKSYMQDLEQSLDAKDWSQAIQDCEALRRHLERAATIALMQADLFDALLAMQECEEEDDMMKNLQSDIDTNLVDWDEMARKSKSHTAAELKAAVARGDVIWSFDSGMSGNDDLLIYPPEVGTEEVMAALEEFFEVGEFADPPTESPFTWGRPGAWSLESLSWQDIVARWPAA